jgi:hypothetical protein
MYIDVWRIGHVGIFAGTAYRAWVRFSSDTVPDHAGPEDDVRDRDQLFGVDGPKLLTPVQLLAQVGPDGASCGVSLA